MLGDDDESSDIMLPRKYDWVSRSYGKLTPLKSSADAEDSIGIGSGCQLNERTDPRQWLLASEGSQFLRKLSCCTFSRT